MRISLDLGEGAFERFPLSRCWYNGAKPAIYIYIYMRVRVTARP